MKKINFIILLFLISVFSNAQPKIKVQIGHSSYILSVDLSSDNKYAITGADDKTIKLWDVATGKEITTYEGHTNTVNSVAISPNNKYILSSGSWDGTVRLWDLYNGNEIYKITEKFSKIEKVAFSSDSKYFAYSVKNMIKICDTSTGKIIKTFTFKEPKYENFIISISFSPDNKFIIAGSNDITLWDISSEKIIRTFSGHKEKVTSVLFSPSGDYIFSSSEDKTIKMWDISTGNEIKTFSGDIGRISSISIEKNGKILVAGSLTDGLIKIWDIEKGNELNSIPIGKDKHGFFHAVYSVKISTDGKYILAGLGNKTAILWDVKNNKNLYTLGGFNFDWTYVLAISPDNKYILLGTFGGNIILCDLFSGKFVRTFSDTLPGYITSASFSPDGKYVLANDLWGNLKLYETKTGNLLHSFFTVTTWLNSYHMQYKSSTFLPNGNILYLSPDHKNVIMCDINSKKEIKKFSDNSYLTIIDVSSNGKYLFTGDANCKTILWDIASGNQIKSFYSGTGIIILSSDGKYVLTPSDNGEIKTIELWDLSKGIRIRTFDAHKSYINSLTLSNDGKTLISTSDDKSIKLWDIETGKEIKTFYTHSEVKNAVFANNEKIIISSLRDGSIKLWDRSSGECLFTFVVTKDGKYLSWTDDGYFAGSEEIAKNYVYIIDKMNIINLNQLFENYYRPDIIAAKIKKENITTYIPKSIKNYEIKTPPIVTIYVKTKKGDYANINEIDSSEFEINNGIIKVNIVAKDNGGGVKGLRLFHNNKAIGENIRSLKLIKQTNIIEQEFDINLFDGENEIKAIGFSDDMTESMPTIAIIKWKAPVPIQPDIYILAVGINEYKNSKYNLNYAVADAEEFVKTLQSKAQKLFKNIYITKLLNKDATREKLINAFESIKMKAKSEDVFIFFYAGHGIALESTNESNNQGTEFYYILHGVTQMTDSEKCLSNGLSGSEMKNLLSSIKASKQVMFIDACNSGAFTSAFLKSRGVAEENALAKLSRASGTAILASTTKDQYAVEFKELGHGVFTYVTIEALKGKAALDNGQITVRKVSSYIDDKIREYSLKYKGEEQYPTSFIWGQDFPIGMK